MASTVCLVGDKRGFGGHRHLFFLAVIFDSLKKDNKPLNNDSKVELHMKS